VTVSGRHVRRLWFAAIIVALVAVILIARSHQSEADTAGIQNLFPSTPTNEQVATYDTEYRRCAHGGITKAKLHQEHGYSMRESLTEMAMQMEEDSLAFTLLPYGLQGCMDALGGRPRTPHPQP
jgi:hypothetical protein